MLAALGLALVLSAPPALPASFARSGPCDLLDRATASQLLGKPVASMEPSAPEPDEDSGGMRSVCVYQAGTSMLMVIQETFKTAEAARDLTTQELVGERYGGNEAVTVEEASGLGDRAFWIHSPTAAEYVVLKGAKVLALLLGGTTRAPNSYQESLRAVTAGLLAKL
jgi:hypothetical protein